MIKQFLNSIFSKEPKATQADVPSFKITKDEPVKTDFEVTELSYEEYAQFVNQDRRKATTYSSHERRGHATAS